MRKRNGFTIIELLVTIAIITTIAAIAIYSVTASITRNKDNSVEIAITNIQSAAELYVLEYYKSMDWVTDQINNDREYTCVLVKDLENSGYLKQNTEVSNANISITGNTIIKVLRDKFNYVIIDTDIDSEGCEE